MNSNINHPHKPKTDMATLALQPIVLMVHAFFLHHISAWLIFGFWRASETWLFFSASADTIPLQRARCTARGLGPKHLAEPVPSLPIIRVFSNYLNHCDARVPSPHCVHQIRDTHAPINAQPHGRIAHLPAAYPQHESRSVQITPGNLELIRLAAEDVTILDCTVIEKPPFSPFDSQDGTELRRWMHESPEEFDEHGGTVRTSKANIIDDCCPHTRVIRGAPVPSGT